MNVRERTDMTNVMGQTRRSKSKEKHLSTEEYFSFWNVVRLWDCLVRLIKGHLGHSLSSSTCSFTWPPRVSVYWLWLFHPCIGLAFATCIWVTQDLFTVTRPSGASPPLFVQKPYLIHITGAICSFIKKDKVISLMKWREKPVLLNP